MSWFLRPVALTVWGIGCLALITPAGSHAEGATAIITIKNHRFEPAELTVPSGVKVRLTVRNEDPTPEEFESYELNREKVIPGNTMQVIYIGPLAPGTYPFFGEFNPDTAQGRLIAK